MPALPNRLPLEPQDLIDMRCDSRVKCLDYKLGVRISDQVLNYMASSALSWPSVTIQQGAKVLGSRKVVRCEYGNLCLATYCRKVGVTETYAATREKLTEYFGGKKNVMVERF